jgi:16S rRNA (guanine527-N7)-methyltransferase
LDKATALAVQPVSRETEARLDVLVEQLRRWQPIKNLVSDHALPELWTRHIGDSLQLAELAPDARNWLDLGSGAGFPGLVIAASLADRPGFHMQLVESNARKCAFLRESARLMNIDVTIHQTRIEDFFASSQSRFDVVSARALAPLPQLIEWCAKLLKDGTTGLFPKGKDARHELTQTAKCWRLDYTTHNSLTDPASTIIRVTRACRLERQRAP